MTSQHRVLAALNHQEPDRVPRDLSSHRSSGISAQAYLRLRRYLGLPERPLRLYDVIQQLAVVDDDVLELLQIDAVDLGRAWYDEPDLWRESPLPDGTPAWVPRWAVPQVEGDRQVLRSSRTGVILAQRPPGTLFFEQVHYPYLQDDSLPLPEVMSESMWTGIASPPGPLVAGPEGRERLSAGAQKLRARTERAIVASFGGNLFEMGQFLYRNDNFLAMLAGEPARAHAFLDRVLEMHLRNLEAFLEAVGPHVDVVLFGDDLGMQTGPLISPRMYREFFRERHRQMWQRVRATALTVKLHCCGGVRELLPDLLEAGLDAINPVQITCRGMEAEGLKRDFGADLAFWGGGCDTRQVLREATPERVQEHVRRQVEGLAPGGGFVFQQVHNVLADVPPENLMAMYEALG